MCNTSIDIIRYFSAVASEDPARQLTFMLLISICCIINDIIKCVTRYVSTGSGRRGLYFCLGGVGTSGIGCPSLGEPGVQPGP